MVLPTDGTNTDSFSRTALIAAANAAPTYDEEGNLTQDSLWKYTWDGQNRLIQMESASGVPAVQPRVKLKFTYDAQSRRIRKQVWQEVTVNTVKTYALKSDRQFLYDGWNLIAEIDPDGSPARTYLWGTDISGSGQGAGGGGGLLAVNILKGPASALGVHFPSYDANGNIIALTNASTGAETARYSYDAFGQELRASGPAAQANPFHFSTKFTDEETGLVYYGYRYLDPASSKWISRDPIQESGGLNLYGFNLNDAVSFIDLLGMHPMLEEPPTEVDKGPARPSPTRGKPAARPGFGADGRPTSPFGPAKVGPELAVQLLSLMVSMWTTPEGKAKADSWGRSLSDPWIEAFIEKVPDVLDEELEMQALAQSKQVEDAEVAQYAALLVEWDRAKKETDCSKRRKQCKFDNSRIHNLRHSAAGHPLAWSVYQRRVAGHNELVITTPSGFSKNFDGGDPPGSNPTKAIEAKYGYVWMDKNLSEFSSKQKRIYARNYMQLNIQSLVCNICGVKFEVALSNDDAVNGFKQHIPINPSPYVVRP